MTMRLAAGLVLLLVSSAVAPPAAIAQSLVFTPVTVIDVRDGMARPDMTVVVSGNRIAAVEPANALEVPSDAKIKLYNRFRPELVTVIAEEAHRLGMTVTGHVPWGMSTIEALQAGMDQINHVSSVAAIGNMIPAPIRESRDVAGALT